MQNTGQIKFLNHYGDITIEWDEDDSVKMEKLIAEKLEQGFQFYIVRKVFGIPAGKKKLKKISKLNDKKIFIKDDDMKKFFDEVESLKTVDDNTTDHTVVKNSKDVKEIAKSTTVATKPPRAG